MNSAVLYTVLVFTCLWAAQCLVITRNTNCPAGQYPSISEICAPCPNRSVATDAFLRSLALTHPQCPYSPATPVRGGPTTLPKPAVPTYAGGERSSPVTRPGTPTSSPNLSSTEDAAAANTLVEVAVQENRQPEALWWLGPLMAGLAVFGISVWLVIYFRHRQARRKVKTHPTHGRGGNCPAAIGLLQNGTISGQEDHNGPSTPPSTAHPTVTYCAQFPPDA